MCFNRNSICQVTLCLFKMLSSCISCGHSQCGEVRTRPGHRLQLGPQPRSRYVGDPDGHTERVLDKQQSKST